MEDLFDVMSNESRKMDAAKAVSSIPSNYVGSKRRMLNHIWDILENNDVEYESVFDAFSGSGMVSLFFKYMGKKVYSNDLLTSSAITAVSLLECEDMPLSEKDIDFLCKNEPDDVGDFVLRNYKDRFFTEKECKFLDRYRRNVELLCGDKFYCGLEVLNKATLMSIPNSNFTLSGDIKSLRSVHKIGEKFANEKWRDTTRKRRDENNEIMFDNALAEMRNKYKSAFSLFAINNHVNQNCFVGGRYYDGQTIAKIEHRLKHEKSNGKELYDFPIKLEKIKKILKKSENDVCVFNSDIIDLLEAKIVDADVLYLDPPYGGASSDYAYLYSFLEEFLYEQKLDEIEHIKKGAERFSKKKGYGEHFEYLLSLCGDFKTWLISYNESSYADIDTIVSTIKNAGMSDVKTFNIPITYQYRKGKGEVDMEHFVENYSNEGVKFSKRGTEYLILAQK